MDKISLASPFLLKKINANSDVYNSIITQGVKARNFTEFIREYTYKIREVKNFEALLSVSRNAKYPLLSCAVARYLLGVQDISGFMGELTILCEEFLDAIIPSLSKILEPQIGIFESKHESGGFCVIGMGKLGAQELNFSSDIDIVFLFSPDGRIIGKNISPEEYFTKLSENLIKALSAVTPEGFYGELIPI